jgi:hypothetical protein
MVFAFHILIGRDTCLQSTRIQYPGEDPDCVQEDPSYSNFIMNFPSIVFSVQLLCLSFQTEEACINDGALVCVVLGDVGALWVQERERKL